MSCLPQGTAQIHFRHSASEDASFAKYGTEPITRQNSQVYGDNTGPVSVRVSIAAMRHHDQKQTQTSIPQFILEGN